MKGLAKTAFLVISPVRFVSKVKNLALWLNASSNPDVVETWTDYFDPLYYLRTYPDVAASGVDPFLHFLLYGGEERRNPSSAFDSGQYLDLYPEVAQARLNPLLHFAVFGKKEGRFPGPRRRTIEKVLETVHETLEVTTINNEWRRDLPLVSVIIPCFNYGRYLEGAIRSVLDQTFQNFEIIVVEGGSTDAESVAEARRLEAASLPKTRFYFREGRHLVGDNRNFGIGMARGRYICCLDADDLLRPVYLEVAVFLAETAGYDIVYPCLQAFGGSTVRWMVCDAEFPGILEYNQITTVALFRRSCWAHVGGYRDWGLGERHVPEDWDFWARLVGHGFRTHAIRELLMLYRAHDAGLTATSVSATLTRQRDQLREANRDLLASAAPINRSISRVLRPFTNLEGHDDDSRPGFLVALPFITVGGCEKLFGELIGYLAKRGERLIVITTLALSSALPDDRNRYDSLTRHVYHLAHLFSDEDQSREFVKYLIRRYDVNLLMFAGCEFIYRMLPELRKEYPSMGVVDQLFNDTVHVPSNRAQSAYIDATIVPSPALAAKLQNASEGQQVTHVIPHGVVIPSESDSATAADSVTVSFFGRLSPEKGPDVFVEIVRRVSHHKHLRFVMTGDGPESERVKSLIDKYRLSDRIHAPGFVDDVEPLMRSTDIVVLPSLVDGMPFAVLEAQAMGKPVIASRVGSLPHMVAHGESGYLCEPGDIDAFCKCILQLAGDAPLRARMGQAGRRLIAERHSGDRMLQQYEAVFDAVRRTARMRTLTGRLEQLTAQSSR